LLLLHITIHSVCSCSRRDSNQSAASESPAWYKVDKGNPDSTQEDPESSHEGRSNAELICRIAETIKLPLTIVSEVASVEEQLKDMATLKCLVKLC